MLTIGAMILLSTIILRTNSTILSTQDNMVSSKVYIMALSKARAIIEEASGKNFDERAISSGFTSSSSFGKEGNERYPSPGYDDFDDFVSYSNDVPVDIIQGIPFNVIVKVNYVNVSAAGAISNSSSTTLHKQMTVGVTSRFMTNPMKITSTNPNGQDTVYMVNYYSYW